VRIALLLLAFVVVALAKPAGSGVMPGKRESDPEVGRTLWKRSCWQCHGELGKGDGPGAAALVGGVPPLPTVEETEFDALVKVVQEGRGRMPAYAENIDRHDSRRIFIYLRELQGGRMKPDGPAPKENDEKADDAAEN
jgi:mono/diheme cytochrome c family protein